jgi:uncharacterized protein YyaL (SSP411 family)
MDNEKQLSRKPNRLINEGSPYLLEHAFNPVDWYPWGDEAFHKARSEDKPIFLSIGYSACHWCHVFRRESLEDGEIAKILNENFVCIKVDREERPDVDEIYMKAVTSMTGSGGWPLNVFLTPKLEPFYGGTYFPPMPRYGMPGFATILRGVMNAWKTERDKILESASQMSASLSASFNSVSSDSPFHFDKEIFDSCFNELTSIFDQKYGGFGGAPKFPTPSNLFFLLRYHADTREKSPLLMVTKTLSSMGTGGIYDQIGGGFHRYSTDREWLVPHFEKMLYDNALLCVVYTEAFLATKDPKYKNIVEETLSWVLREMTDKDGGFYSAVDADSSEGEGSYYLWNLQKIREAVSMEKGNDEHLEQTIEMVSEFYGVSPDGNFDDGKTILTTSEQRTNRLCSKYSLSRDQFDSKIQEARETMRRFREKRPRPMTDDKVLASWNGLMISALSKAYQAFGDAKFIEAAIRCANFIRKNLILNEGSLRMLHRYRKGEAKGFGLLEDYSYFTNGLVDLYESTFESQYLKLAIELAQVMSAEFNDRKHGAFFLSPEDSKDLIARPKVGFDGALPSANSVATFVLLRLSEITGNAGFRDLAVSAFRAFSDKIEQQPSAFAYMISSLYFELAEPKEIVISGIPNSKDFKSLLGVVRSLYLPNSVTVFADEKVKALSPLVEGRVGSSGQTPKVYVCKGKVCQLPSSNEAELLEALKS